MTPPQGLRHKQKIVFRYGCELQPHDSVNRIHGIGQYYACKLKGLNVVTVGDLRALVESQKDDIDREKKFAFLLKMPQFISILKIEIK